LQALGNGFYARTTQGPRAAVWLTISGILKRACGGGLPLNESKLLTLAAALEEGGYRAAKSYLYRAKQKHVRGGFEWSEVLQDVLKLCVRSASRGLGPGKTANAFLLENVAKRGAAGINVAQPVIEGGPIAPFDAAIVAAAWMMRALEAASVLGEQVTMAHDFAEATIDLGRGCPTSLRCSCKCGSAAGSLQESGCCPVHTLARILEERESLGLEGKYCRLCNTSGHAVSSKKTIDSLRIVSGESTCSEHSMRKAGAQYYARKSVPLFLIQFIGRWGSLVVSQYVGNAFLELALKASLGESSLGPVSTWGGASESGLVRAAAKSDAPTDQAVLKALEAWLNKANARVCE